MSGHEGDAVVGWVAAMGLDFIVNGLIMLRRVLVVVVGGDYPGGIVCLPLLTSMIHCHHMGR